MIMNLKQTIRDMLVRHEGWKEKIYQDTKGIPTIGVGFNLEDPGLYPEEIEFILMNRIGKCIKDLSAKFPWFEHLDPPRYCAMIDLYYNLGSSVFGFKQFLAEMQQAQYFHAADDLLDSRYAKQLPGRSSEIAYIIRHGELKHPED